MTWWANLKLRYAVLVEEFGSAALGTYIVLWLGTWFSFWLAIRTGYDAGSTVASAGTIGGAWVLTKATQPIRIGATIVLTPLLVALWHRVRPPATTPEP